MDLQTRPRRRGRHSSPARTPCGSVVMRQGRSLGTAVRQGRGRAARRERTRSRRSARRPGGHHALTFRPAAAGTPSGGDGQRFGASRRQRVRARAAQPESADRPARLGSGRPGRSRPSPAGRPAADRRGGRPRVADHGGPMAQLPRGDGRQSSVPPPAGARSGADPADGPPTGPPPVPPSPRPSGVPGRRRARRGCFGDGAHNRRTGARGTLTGRGAGGRQVEARCGGNTRPITGGFPAKGPNGGRICERAPRSAYARHSFVANRSSRLPASSRRIQTLGRHGSFSVRGVSVVSGGSRSEAAAWTVMSAQGVGRAGRMAGMNSRCVRRSWHTHSWRAGRARTITAHAYGNEQEDIREQVGERE